MAIECSRASWSERWTFGGFGMSRVDVEKHKQKKRENLETVVAFFLNKNYVEVLQKFHITWGEYHIRRFTLFYDYGSVENGCNGKVTILLEIHPFFAMIMGGRFKFISLGILLMRSPPAPLFDRCRGGWTWQDFGTNPCLAIWSPWRLDDTNLMHVLHVT